MRTIFWILALFQVSIRLASSTQIHYIPWDVSVDLRAHLLTVDDGDKVRFLYGNTVHDIVEVTKERFLACNTKDLSGPATGFGARGLSEGDPNIELSPPFVKPGIRYFICTLPGHCLAGMKLRVNTVIAGSTTTLPEPEVDVSTCTECGVLKEDGKLSCCAPRGSWFDKCGNPGDTRYKYTFFDGTKACENRQMACPLCGVSKKGKTSCCYRGGAWFKTCGDPDANAEHTWAEGTQACKAPVITTTPPTPITIHDVPWDVSVNIGGRLLLVAPGDKVRFQYRNSEHNVVEVRQSQFLECNTRELMPPSTGFGSLSLGGNDDIELSPPFEEFGIRYFICSLPGHCLAGMKIRISTEGLTTQPAPQGECKCGKLKKSGKLSCCAPGGEWFRKCGNPGDTKFAHTWFDGIAACKEPGKTTDGPLICPKCGLTNGGKVSCCAKGGEWYQKCGGAAGQKQYTWGQGIESCKNQRPERTTATSCAKCGVNLKTLKASCCLPGGSWEGDCGMPGDPKFTHSWGEGNKACQNPTSTSTTTTKRTTKRKTTTTTKRTTKTTTSSRCRVCGTNKKNGQVSCCFKGGSWFKKCGEGRNFAHSWGDGIRSCKDVTTTQRFIAPACPKCAKHHKNGKFSCCYKGGAWDGNCGNPGDINFRYTWGQGMDGCKSQAQRMGSHQTKESLAQSNEIVRTDNAQRCNNIANPIVWMSLLLINFYMHM